MFNKIINFLKNKKIFFFAMVFAFMLSIFDIWTKRYAFKSVNNIIYKTHGVHTHIQITNFLNIVKVINTGISFGIFNNIPYGQYILSSIVLLIIIFLLYLLWKSNNKYDIFIYSVIIAGGIGNLYDRIIFGGVFDFLDFHIGEYHWPAFNVADSLICIGVSLLLLKDFINYMKSKKNN